MLRLPRFFRSAFLKFAFVYPFVQLLVFLPLQWTREDYDRDSIAYFLAAERIQSGQPLYDPLPPSGPHIIDAPYYLYPPFFAAAIAVFPPTSYATFSRIWLLILLSAFWVFAASIGKMVVGRTTLKGTLVAGAALALVPGTIRALNLGQADVLIWALVGVGLAYPSARGAGFTLGALIKVLPVWPLVVSGLRARRSVLQGSAIATVIAVGISVVALSPSQFFRSSQIWVREVAPTLSQGQFVSTQDQFSVSLPLGQRELELRDMVPSNLSLSFAPLQLAKQLNLWDPEPGPLSLPVRIYLAILSFGVPILLAWMARRQPVDLQCSLVLLGAFLFSPILRITNFPILLLPLVLYWSKKHRERSPQPAAA